MSTSTSGNQKASENTMAEPNNSKISWDFQLNFELPAVKVEAPPPKPPRILPRELLKAKFPRILDRVEVLWGTLELHKYFEQTLYTDRSTRQGFPPEVMQALGELHGEHRKILISGRIIIEDVWDKQFGR